MSNSCSYDYIGVLTLRPKKTYDNVEILIKQILLYKNYAYDGNIAIVPKNYDCGKVIIIVEIWLCCVELSLVCKYDYTGFRIMLEF